MFEKKEILGKKDHLLFHTTFPKACEYFNVQWIHWNGGDTWRWTFGNSLIKPLRFENWTSAPSSN